MKSRRNLLKRSQLYLILDKAGFAGRSLKSLCSEILASGVGLIQLRDKISAKADVLNLAIRLAKRLKGRPEGRGLPSIRPQGHGLASCGQSHRQSRRPEGRGKTLFIVNDYLDIAVLSKADGLHLGQADLPLRQARSILGKDKIIGISCHNLRQALKAQKEGADYIGIGPVYATVTKPEYSPIGINILKQLKGKIKIPYFAIGNINKSNIRKIVSAGARRVAVCRAILGSKNIGGAAKELLVELNIK